MSFLAVLNIELMTDPLSRGYSGMSDLEAADDLNTVYRTIALDTVSGSAIFNATDDAEFGALTDAEQDQWMALCAVGSIDTTSGVAKALESDIFGPGTTTRDNLVALRTQDVSRAVELGLGVVTEGDVNKARAYV